MSIKKLFDAKKAGKIGNVATTTGKKLADSVESIGQVQEAIEKNTTFVPKIDYSKPENFVKYGSAYRYYYDTFGYVKNYYPYDGSSKDKLEFFNDLTPFEQYILDNEYPKSTGYVTIGAIYGADGASKQGYTTPTTAEHIQFKGGPHTGTFFATGSHLSNNLEFGGVSGSTVEFYYNKTEFDSSVSSPTEVILDVWNGVASGSHDYGRLTIETDSGSADRFYVSYQSGSSGVFKAAVPTAGGLTLGSGSWDHYAFVFTNSGASTSISLFENGACKQNNILTGSSINLVTGSLIGRLGALRTAPGPIQPSGYGAQATATDAIDMSGYQAAGDPSSKFNITIPVAAGGTNTAVTIKFDISSGGSPSSTGANHINIGTAGSGDAANAALVIKAINGTADSRITFGSGVSSGIQGITATAGSTSTKVTLTIDKGGTSGNITSAVAHGAGTVNLVDVANFTGGAVIPAGDGKLSASLDEFRFWKEPRDPVEIGQNWYMAVNGGANTTYNNSTLGVYFKFNEGITEDSSTDSTVLDYSGRLSNGTWTGYSTSGTRNTGSAIVSSSAAPFEAGDPIIYGNHPTYISRRADLSNLGETYDFNNNSSLYYTLPGWIIEQDEQNGSQIAILTQIMGSYLDTLYAQISNVLTIKDKSYVTGSNLESPNNDRLLSSLGFEAPELFDSVNEIVRYLDKDDKRPLEKSIHQIKNVIYKNLYNNLSYILKSKGTRKSFTNTLRCLGIDEKLVKISTYGDNVSYPLTSSYKETSHESKYIDFTGLRRGDDTEASVYQFYYADGYDGGSSGIIQQNTSLGPNTFTLQADINFPLRPQPGSKNYITPASVTASLFGFHTPNSTSATATDTTWANPEVDYGLQVYSVHAQGEYSLISSEDAASKDVYFEVKDRLGNIILQTDTISDVYDDTRWVLSLNVRPETYPFAQDVDGAEIHNHKYIVELYGSNFISDQKNASFQNSSTVVYATGSNILTSAKRVYVGAHRTNNTGGILQRSDIRVGACRAWNSFLTSSDVDHQARIASVYGSQHPYRNTNTFQASGSDVYVPSIESLMLNWDFETVTGSDASGQFRVDDFTSGSNSSNYENNYQAAYASTQRHHSARGDFFKANDKPARKQYLPTLELQPPEEIASDDMITIILEGSDDDVFGRDRRPVRYSFAVEKSLYDGISSQMLNMFGSIKDFNNLIGEPVNKYRAEYKDLGKLREIFFRRVTNDKIDLDKYLDYYKWLDGSLTNMIEQLFPASAMVAPNVRNIVESHVLERNKYQHKYPTIEGYPFEPSGSIRGGFESQYSWRFNHHPPTMTGSLASAVDAIDLDGYQAAADPSTRFTIQIPVAAGGSNTTITIKFDVSSTSDPSSFGSNSITIATAGSDDAANAALVVKAINGTADDRITYGNDAGGGTDAITNIGVLGISAAQGSNTKKVTLTMTVAGTSGNISSAIAHGAGTVNLVDVNDFTGASDKILKEAQNENCSWWQGRADRDGVALSLGPNAAASAGVQLDRQNLFKVTGRSVLEQNRKKLYKFESVVTNNIVGGSNEFANKAKTNVLSFSSVASAKDCTDAVVPPGSPLEKVRQGFRVSIAGENFKGNRLAPFSLYNALNEGTHNKMLTDNGLSGSQITNLHEDAYFGSGYEVPMQGPFTNTHVGGLLARASGLRMQTDPTLRREKFRLSVSSGTGVLANIDTETGALSSGKGHYYRGLTSKSPVNIANIAHVTSSVSGNVLGNFDRTLNYQVVQTSGRSINNIDLRDDPTAYAPNPLLSPYVGDVVETPIPTRRGDQATISTRTSQKSVFTERFSAPGGVETSSPLYLDFYASELSPNNALPFRNTLTREIINGRLQVHQARGGQLGSVAGSLISSGFTVQDLNTGSFGFDVISRHDTQRNTLQRPVISGYFAGKSNIYTVTTGSVKDNAFITHPIPRADRLSWLQALSGSSSTSEHDLFNSGSVTPEVITVPSRSSLVQGTGYDGTLPGGTVIPATAEQQKLLLDGTSYNGSSAGGFNKFALSGSAFILSDANGVKYGVCLNLSGTTGPSGPEDDLLAAGVAANKIFHVTIQFSSNSGNVLDQISQSININAPDLDNSIVTHTTSSDNNPSNHTFTFATGTAITDVQPIAGPFTTINNDAVSYLAATSPSGTFTSRIGAVVLTQGGPAGFLRTQVFENMKDYREDDTSAVLSASDGTVQYRWGVGKNYNSWQQIRQSQIRNRESILPSNKVRIYDRTISDAGSVVEVEREISEPVVQYSYKPIVTTLSIVDDASPEDDQLVFRDIVIEHSYTNQKATFINGDVRTRLGGKPKSQMFVYDSLRDVKSITYSKKLSAEDTGIGRIKSHKLRQDIYPKVINANLSSSQVRDNFQYTRWRDDDEVFAALSKADPHKVVDGFGFIPATEENFVPEMARRAAAQNRQSPRWQVGYVNSQGYVIEQKFQYPFDSAEGVTAPRTGNGTASIWPMDSFAYGDGLFSGSHVMLTGVTVDISSAATNVDFFGGQASGVYNLAAGELMTFKFGAPGRTGSAPNQGYTPTPWYSKRSCHYMNQLMHLDFDSLTGNPVNYTQSVEQGSVGGVFFAPPWTAGRDRRAVDGPNKGSLIESRGPFYDTYKDFSEGQKQLGRGMSLIPEFRISEHIDLYEVQNFGDYYAFNSSSYSITGAADLASSAQNGFMARYQNTDFIRFLNQFMIDDKEINGLPSDLSLEVRGVQKVLPYDGFYPMVRSLQLATLFSQSYTPGATFEAETGTRGGGNQTDISGAGWQNVLDYFYAPGIMYNSIKSGIAVDHPVFINRDIRFNREPGEVGFFLSASGDPRTFAELSNYTKDSPIIRRNNHGIGVLNAGNFRMEVARIFKEKPLPRRLGTFEKTQPTGSEEFLAHLLYYPDRINFETIVNPTEYLLDNKFVNNQIFDWQANDITSSFYTYANNKYVKGAGNFFGAVPEVFLENSTLTTIASDPTLVNPGAIPVQSGTLYAMEISLRKTDNFNMYSNPIAFGPCTATGSAFDNNELLANAGVTGSLRDKYGSVLKADWGMVRFGARATSSNLSGSTPSGSVWPLLHGNNAPHTPPYWYGASWARVYFLPTGSGLLTLNEIIAASEIEYGNDNDYLFDFRFNDLNQTDVSAAYGSTTITQGTPMTHGNGGLGVPGYLWNRAWQNKMEIKASITVDNVHPGNIQPNDSWVIMPKWECPILDFPVRAEPWATNSGSYNFSASFAYANPDADIGLRNFIDGAFGKEACPQQGMWHQYGVTPNPGEGVQMLIKDLGSGEKEKRLKAVSVFKDSAGNLPSIIAEAEEQFLPKIPNSLVDITETGDRKREVRSLAKLVGFPAEVVNQPVNLGKVADRKEFSEAIVALPYFKDNDGQLQFIPIPIKDESNQVVQIFGKQTARLRRALTKYVLPPTIERRMSFLAPETYPRITEEDLSAKPINSRLDDENPPIAMYLFEFTTTFNKQDLADWWQGIMPEASKKFEKAKVYTIDHAMPGVGLQDFGAKPGAGGGKVDRRLRDLIDNSEFIHSSDKDSPGFRPDIQWMVFKVKQRAAGSYEEMIRNSLRFAGATIQEPTGQLAYEKRMKGFNWPYDFFSIVELAKIEAGVTFRPDIDEIDGDGDLNNKNVESLDGPDSRTEALRTNTRRSPGQGIKVN